MVQTATILQFKVRAKLFGARGCSSCSCNPCDCNPCECGGTQLSYPAWRVSGFAVDRGIINGVDVSSRILLALSLPVHPSEPQGAWYEVLLVERQASTQQTHALLSFFESQLESMPAEVSSYRQQLRDVYAADLEYHLDKGASLLSVSFSSHAMPLIRSGQAQIPPTEWMYSGLVQLRQFINSHS